jgi:NitT/TauT family transport system substrate-binding protein
MLLFAILPVMLAVPANGAENLVTVKLGVMAGEAASYIPIVGDELGIYEKYGIKISVQEFSTGINTVDAVILGQLDFGGGADFALLNRIGGSEKSELRICAKSGVSLPGTPYSWKFYVNDDTVQSPAELSGKSIALRKGTIEEYWTAKLIEYGGIDPDSVKILPIGSPLEGVAAIKAKQITGMWGGGQTSVTLSEIEGVRAIADLVLIKAKSANYTVSTSAYLSENRKLVANYFRAANEIVEFIQNEPRKTAEIVSKRTNAPVAQVEVNLQRNDLSIDFTQSAIDELDVMNEWARGAGFIRKVFDARDYVNVDALKEAFPDRVNYK